MPTSRHHLDLPPGHRQHRDHPTPSTRVAPRWFRSTARSGSNAATGGKPAASSPPVPGSSPRPRVPLAPRGSLQAIAAGRERPRGTGTRVSSRMGRGQRGARCCLSTDAGAVRGPIACWRTPGARRWRQPARGGLGRLLLHEKRGSRRARPRSCIPTSGVGGLVDRDRGRYQCSRATRSAVRSGILVKTLMCPSAGHVHSLAPVMSSAVWRAWATGTTVSASP
jgi:hypothetical protein